VRRGRVDHNVRLAGYGRGSDLLQQGWQFRRAALRGELAVVGFCQQQELLD
jgi:hypothetical protein